MTQAQMREQNEQLARDFLSQWHGPVASPFIMNGLFNEFCQKVCGLEPGDPGYGVFFVEASRALRRVMKEQVNGSKWFRCLHRLDVATNKPLWQMSLGIDDDDLARLRRRQSDRIVREILEDVELTKLQADRQGVPRPVAMQQQAATMTTLLSDAQSS